MRDGDIQSELQNCQGPGTQTQGEKEPLKGRPERIFTQELQQGIKMYRMFFAFQSMIPFPVFVILKLKTFGSCARQQK